MGKKIICISAIALVVTVIILVVIISSSSNDKSDGKVKIETPEDTGGLIIHYLVNEKKYLKAETNTGFEMYSTKDCCGSGTGLAFSSTNFDIAIMCPDAARKLIKKDERYEILSPCLVNSNILVIKTGMRPKKIGVAENRYQQKQMVKERYGRECAIVPMYSMAIPFAYEKNAVDGIVVDGLKGLTLDGEKVSAANEKADLVTYVLVVRKAFKRDSRFKEFIELFKRSVRELNNPDVLRKAIGDYKGLKFTLKEVKKWNQLKIRFVYTTRELHGSRAIK